MPSAPDEERRRLVEGLTQRGASRDEIFAALDKLESAYTGGPEVPTSALLGKAGLKVPPSTSPPVTPAEQAAGKKYFTETLPRQAVQAGAGLAAGTLTGGMGFIPAVLTETGTSGAADLLYQAVRKLINPERTINPNESMNIGAQAGLGYGATRGILSGVQSLAAGRARINPEAVRIVTEEAPMGGRKAYNMVKAKPQGAEYELDKQIAGTARNARAPSLPEAQASMERYSAGKAIPETEGPVNHPLEKSQFESQFLDNLRAGKFSGLPPSVRGPDDIRHELVSRAVKNGEAVPREVLADYPDLLKQAESMVQPDRIRRFILGLQRAPVTGEERAANATLNQLAKDVPKGMTIQDLHDYLQRIREPIKEQLGRPGGSLLTGDMKSIQNFVRGYRDDLLASAGEKSGVDAFAAASKEIDKIDKAKDLMLEADGSLKRSSVNIIRRVLGNPVIMNVLEDLDSVAKTNWADKARNLVIRGEWNAPLLQDAGALTEIMSNAKLATTGNRRFARGVAKGLAVVGPRGVPAITGGVAGGALKAKAEEEKRLKAKSP